MITLENTLDNWDVLPLGIFLQLKKNSLYLIKFRDVLGQKSLFNTVEPIEGVKLLDTIGTNDYFIGEFIFINQRLFKITYAKNAIVLNTLRKTKRPDLQVIRDDGFLKLYRTINSSLVITTL